MMLNIKPLGNKGSVEKMPTVIRVIEVKRTLIDPIVASQEELSILLNELQKIPQLNNSTSALNTFVDLSKILQNSPFLIEKKDDNTLNSVLIRDLLLNPAVHPIISAQGFAATKVESEKHTRPTVCIQALDENGNKIAIAAEEPIIVTGFAINPFLAGSLIVSSSLGIDTYVSSGTFSTHTFATNWKVKPPEYNDSAVDDENGYKITTTDNVKILVKQSHAAANFYYSGTATAIVLSSISAALHGLPGASSKLVKLFKPMMLDKNIISTTVLNWRDVDANARLRYLLERLSTSELIAAKDPALWVFNLSPLNDLFRVGALGIYLYALVEGRESQKLEIFLERMSMRYLKSKQLDELSHKAVLASSRARLYLIIIEDKFGSVRSIKILDALRTAIGSRSRGAPGGSLALPSESVQVVDPESVIKLLTKKEREIVLIEYENRRKQWEASVGNKCPHIRLAFRMRNATHSKDVLKHLYELEKYITPSNRSTEWLICRNCKFRALCPHVRERIIMESKKASYDEVRTSLMKYAIRVNNDNDLYTYYCKICSEKLAEAIDEDRTAEILGRFGNIDSGLRIKIWSTAIRAVRNMQFSIPTDEKQFSNAATAVIYPLIIAAEAVIIKKGSNRRRKIVSHTDEETEELDNRTQLYIVIFVYAYILNLIQNSQTKIGFTGVKNGAKASVYAEKMLQIIIEEYKNIIAQIEDISTDFLKTRFTEAYRIVHNESNEKLQTSKPDEELAFQTMIDPIYRYAATVATVAGDLSATAGARKEFETILGDSVPNIVKMSKDSAKNPDLAALYLRRTGVEVPTGGTLEFLMKDPRVNLYVKIYEPKSEIATAKALDAFHSFANLAIDAPANDVRYWIGGIKRSPHTKKIRPENKLDLAMRGAFFEGYRLFTKYTKGIINQNSATAYYKDLAKYQQCDDGLRIARALANTKTYYDFKVLKSQQFIPSEVSITSIYDENGVRHDWCKQVTYYYIDINAPTTEIEIKGGPKGAVLAHSEGRLTVNMKLIDIACPICGIRASKTNTLDHVKVEKSIVARSEIESFFLFYESRCPLGDLHDWKTIANKVQSCTKCGLTDSIFISEESLKNTNAIEYYEKYLQIFYDDRVKLHTTVLPKNKDEIVNIVISEDAKAWQPDYTFIIRAAELVGVVPALLEAIGNMEGREYKDIILGIGIPQMPTASSDPRLLTADAEVRLFLADYSMLRNASKFLKLPPILSNILTEANVPKHEYINLQQLLPDVSNNYHSMFTAIMKFRSPEDAYVFAIQSLCRMAVEVAIFGTGWLNQLCRIFAKKEIETILHSQKLFSKPGSFNWAIFETDMEIDEQVGDVGEDVLEELLELEGEERIEDPFSGEHMDYDTTENEPNNEQP